MVGAPGVRLWVIATPDHTDPGGEYVENLRPGEDISGPQGLSPENHRPHLEESVNACAEPVSMDRLRELVDISEPLARETAGPAVVPVDAPLLVLPWGSSVAVRLD